MQHVRSEVLDAAKAAVCDRPGQYGQPENNFARIAARWNAHLDNIGHVVTRQGIPCRLVAHDVAIMLADVKIARLESNPSHRDSWVDLAGYAACGAEVAPVTDDAMHASLGKFVQVHQQPGETFLDAAERTLRNEQIVREQAEVPDELRCWPPTEMVHQSGMSGTPPVESKFGFYVGETVNLRYCGTTEGHGDRPGEVVGFDKGSQPVLVRWRGNSSVSTCAPHQLRHGA